MCADKSRRLALLLFNIDFAYILHKFIYVRDTLCAPSGLSNEEHHSAYTHMDTYIVPARVGNFLPQTFF